MKKIDKAFKEAFKQDTTSKGSNFKKDSVDYKRAEYKFYKSVKDVQDKEKGNVTQSDEARKFFKPKGTADSLQKVRDDKRVAIEKKYGKSPADKKCIPNGYCPPNPDEVKKKRGGLIKKK